MASNLSIIGFKVSCPIDSTHVKCPSGPKRYAGLRLPAPPRLRKRRRGQAKVARFRLAATLQFSELCGAFQVAAAWGVDSRYCWPRSTYRPLQIQKSKQTSKCKANDVTVMQILPSRSGHRYLSQAAPRKDLNGPRPSLVADSRN